MKVFRNQFRE